MQAPVALLGLVALLLMLWWLSSRRRARDAVRFSNLEVLASVTGEPRFWYRRWLPETLLLAAVAFLVLALARPQLRQSAGHSPSTVVFVIDSAGSMAQKDLGPTRLLVAKRVATSVLDRMPRLSRVGLVALESDEPETTETGQAATASDDVQVLAERTTDHAFVRSMIGSLSLGYPSESGDGLVAALTVINESGAQSRRGPRSSSGHTNAPIARIELLTDGQDSTGRALSLRAARQARSLRVAIDTITLNSSQGGADPPPPEGSTLDRIAQLSGGHSYTLGNSTQLSDLDRQLAASLNTTHTRIRVTVYLLAATVSLVGSASILSLLWRPRLP